MSPSSQGQILLYEHTIELDFNNKIKAGLSGSARFIFPQRCKEVQMRMQCSIVDPPEHLVSDLQMPIQGNLHTSARWGNSLPNPRNNRTIGIFSPFVIFNHWNKRKKGCWLFYFGCRHRPVCPLKRPSRLNSSCFSGPADGMCGGALKARHLCYVCTPPGENGVFTEGFFALFVPVYFPHALFSTSLFAHLWGRHGLMTQSEQNMTMDVLTWSLRWTEYMARGLVQAADVQQATAHIWGTTILFILAR